MKLDQAAAEPEAPKETAKVAPSASRPVGIIFEIDTEPTVDALQRILGPFALLSARLDRIEYGAHDVVAESAKLTIVVSNIDGRRAEQLRRKLYNLIAVRDVRMRNGIGRS